MFDEGNTDMLSFSRLLQVHLVHLVLWEGLHWVLQPLLVLPVWR